MSEPESLEKKAARRPRFQPHSIARYRLSLVREGETSYELAHRCADPEAAALFAHRVLNDAHQENLGCLFLDTRHRAIGYHIAYSGSLTRISVEPRGLLVPALLCNANAIIAFHNHPSGDASPSAEDIAFTRRLVEAGEVVGIRLLDHLVLGDPPQYVSLRQRGVY